MAVGAPFLVIKATGTNDAVAADAVVEAAPAMCVKTMGALADTAGAETAAAVTASGLAFAADRVLAALAQAAILGRNGFTAVDAIFAIPQCEFDKGAVAVVGPQQIHDELKEVKQPSLDDRLPDGCPSFAFAKDLVEDVRMGNAFAGSSWMGIDCDYSVRRLGGQLSQVESNLKRS